MTEIFGNRILYGLIRCKQNTLCTNVWVLKLDVAGTSPSSVNCELYLLSYCCLVAKSCLTLCGPINCSLPGSTVRGISQARILEWAAFPNPGDLPNPGIKPVSLALQADSLSLSHLQIPTLFRSITYLLNLWHLNETMWIKYSALCLTPSKYVVHDIHYYGHCC